MSPSAPGSGTLTAPAAPDRGTHTTPAGPRPVDDELRELAAQEERLVLGAFSNDDAWRLGSLLVELAQERGAAVTIGIRRGAQQLFHCALPGTSADNDAWIARKSAVVERYAESSYLRPLDGRDSVSCGAASHAR
ncbi:hypothetical protein Spla01_06080 [Streptomyces platensis]|uniref:Uncharacterized protein n=1 Tax=Streptomyces platensis TaxID=58346 RepID=A0ABX3XVZ7_STRPT|nr:hypothetical protein BG653_03661 [Streptomyces platensis]